MIKKIISFSSVKIRKEWLKKILGKSPPASVRNIEDQKQPNEINFSNQDDVRSDVEKDFVATSKKPDLPKWLVVLIIILLMSIAGDYIYYYYFISESEAYKSCGNSGELVNPEEKNCCGMLRALEPKTPQITIEKGTCAKSSTSVRVCSFCGDLICNPDYEDVCNCPVDCKEEDTFSIGNGWHTYMNKKYRFQLSLTDNWGNFKTFPNTYKSLNGEDDVFGIDFCLTTNSGYNECLFKISGISIKKADEFRKGIALCEKEQVNENTIGRKCNDEIGRNDKYIFTLGVIVQDSSNEGALALKDIPKIIDSFQTF